MKLTCFSLEMNRQLYCNKGFTLLELLIALVISTIIILGITTVLLSSAEARNRVVGLQQLQEEATVASQLLKQQLSQIGYRGIDLALIDSRVIPVNALDQEFPAVVNSWQAGQIVKADTNSLTYRFAGATDFDGNPDGSIRTCLGGVVGQGEIIESRLFLTDGELRCQVGADTEVLAGDTEDTVVEQLLVEFGIDSNGDLLLDTFKPAATSTQNDLLNVLFVRIRLLVASSNNAASMSSDYRFNGGNFNSSDNRIRREVVVAMDLRN